MRSVLLSWLGLLVLLVLMPPATQGAEVPTLAERRLVLLGMDSATWTVLEPLIRMGKLPAWKRFVEESAVAPLDTFQPTASLLIWTTIATGRTPEDHGLNDWTDKATGGLALTSNLRQVEALWTIFPKYRRSVAFHNWWGSWPAEATKGATISRRFYLNEYQRFFPPTLGSTVDVGAERALFRGEFFASALKEHLQLSQRIAPGDLSPRMGRDLTTLSNWLAFDERTVDIGTELLKRYAPDLTGIFIRGLDPAKHLLWDTLEPEGWNLSPEEHQQFRSIVPEYYRYYERFLQEILAAIDDQTSIILVSDHGMYSAHREQPQLMNQGPRIARESRFIRSEQRVTRNTGLHNLKPEGVFMAWGPLFKEGRIASPVSVYDITPTILAAFRMAVADDMPGTALVELFEPGVADRVERIPTYESGTRQPATPIPSKNDAAIREDLRGLGYIGE